MRPVFLDTVGVIATWEVRDQWHADAEAAFAAILAERRPMISTTTVFWELGNAAARRPYRQRVIVLRQALAEEGYLIEPTPNDVDDAWQNYERGLAGQAGIVDHVSFVVMQRFGITEAFTNDRHFQAAGFETLF